MKTQLLITKTGRTDIDKQAHSCAKSDFEKDVNASFAQGYRVVPGTLAVSISICSQPNHNLQIVEIYAVVLERE